MQKEAQAFLICYTPCMSMGIPQEQVFCAQYALGKEPWEQNRDYFTNPQHAFVHEPPVFTTLHGAGPRPLPVHFGMSEGAVDALVRRSKDEEEKDILTFVPDDIKTFGSVDACARWLADKNRFPFMVVNEGGQDRAPELAAFLWFTEEALPEDAAARAKRAAADRFSLRVYRAYAGKGIGEILGGELLRWHGIIRPDRDVWLSVRSDNKAGLHVYEKLCFEEIGTFTGTDGMTRFILVHNRDHFQNMIDALPYAV